MDTWSRSGSSSVEEFLETCGAAMLLSGRVDISRTYFISRNEVSFFFYARVVMGV